HGMSARRLSIEMRMTFASFGGPAGAAAARGALEDDGEDVAGAPDPTATGADETPGGVAACGSFEHVPARPASAAVAAERMEKRVTTALERRARDAASFSVGRQE